MLESTVDPSLAAVCEHLQNQHRPERRGESLAKFLILFIQCPLYLAEVPMIPLKEVLWWVFRPLEIEGLTSLHWAEVVVPQYDCL
jgi:hypothetical protein